MLEPLYAPGKDTGNARSEAKLDEPEIRIDDILKAELARNTSGACGDGNEMTALGLAAQSLRHLMQQRRTALRGAP